MPDITIAIDGRTLRGDWTLTAGDLTSGDDLKTSILVSLLTETGWWPDAYDELPIGSRLLELLRAKHTQETLLRARDYCRQSLAWLVGDGIARAVNVQTEWQRNSLLAIGIEVVKMNGATERFSWVWEAV